MHCEARTGSGVPRTRITSRMIMPAATSEMDAPASVASVRSLQGSKAQPSYTNEGWAPHVLLRPHVLMCKGRRCCQELTDEHCCKHEGPLT